MTYVNVSLTWPVAMKHDWNKKKIVNTRKGINFPCRNSLVCDQRNRTW